MHALLALDEKLYMWQKDRRTWTLGGRTFMLEQQPESYVNQGDSETALEEYFEDVQSFKILKT